MAQSKKQQQVEEKQHSRVAEGKSQAQTGGHIKNLVGDIRLNWGTRFAYASGDIACNIVFGTIGAVLTLFYTDYVGINGAVVATIMLICRCFDGFSDLIMGFIVV